MLVPERVTALIALPINPDWRISKGVMLTVISSNASIDIGVPPAGKFPPPPVLIPNELLKSDPSIVILFCLKLPPPIDTPFACGVMRVKSFILLEILGSAAISITPTFVVAPVL